MSEPCVTDDKKSFFEKHKPLSDDEIKMKFKEADASKETYTRDMEEVEKNLLGYTDILDPIVDPESGKILAWMRRPTNEELEEYYSMYDEKDIKTASKEEKIAMSSRQYKIMEKLLMPKHDAEWWKTKTNPLFIKLFANRLMLFFESLGYEMENFQQAT